MKRREFLKSGLGIAGFMGLISAGSIFRTADAEDQLENEEQLENDETDFNSDFELTDETVDHDFTYQGHRVKIMRREFQRRRNVGRTRRDDPSNFREHWVMKMDGKELPQHFFKRLDAKDCYYSELLPFSDQCHARALAKELVDGHEMRLFDVLGN